MNDDDANQAAESSGPNPALQDAWLRNDALNTLVRIPRIHAYNSIEDVLSDADKLMAWVKGGSAEARPEAAA